MNFRFATNYIIIIYSFCSSVYNSFGLERNISFFDEWRDPFLYTFNLNPFITLVHAKHLLPLFCYGNIWSHLLLNLIQLMHAYRFWRFTRICRVKFSNEVNRRILKSASRFNVPFTLTFKTLFGRSFSDCNFMHHLASVLSFFIIFKFYSHQKKQKFVTNKFNCCFQYSVLHDYIPILFAKILLFH